MKILVTGGTGFLGSHLVPRLCAAGHSVRVLSRAPFTPSAAFTPSGVEGPVVEHVRGDLTDRALVRGALDGVEAIYHLAGRVSFRSEDGRAMYALHVEGTRLLLEAVSATGSRPRIVLASTSGTIAVSKTERIGTEADDYPLAVVGRWPYYLSKIYEEKLALEYCRAHELPLVVLNPSLLLGPGDDRLSSTWLVAKFLAGDIPVMPRGGLSFVDVRDAADVFVAALERGECYGRHLIGVNLKLSELFLRLERMTGVAAPRLRLPSALKVLGAHFVERAAKARGGQSALSPQEVDIGEHFFYLDAAKAQAQLGFAPRDTHDTLFDTVGYLRSKMPPARLSRAN